MELSLTKQQKETIKHLKRLKNIKTKEDILTYLNEKLIQPRRSRRPIDKTRPYRRHSIKYYQEMIEFYQKTT